MCMHFIYIRVLDARISFFCRYTDIYVYTQCMFACMCVHTVYIYVYIYIYIYIYIYM